MLKFLMPESGMRGKVARFLDKRAKTAKLNESFRDTVIKEDARIVPCVFCKTSESEPSPTGLRPGRRGLLGFAMKKKCFFIGQDWKKRCFAITLSALPLYGFATVQGGGLTDDSGSGKAAAGAQDALLSVAEARELREMREAVKRLELENRTLRAEREMLHRELIEVTDKYQVQNESSRELRQVLAGALASGGVRNAGKREDQLLKIIADVSERGGELALKSAQFCEFVETLLGEASFGVVRRAEIRLRLDALKKESREFISLTSVRDPEAALMRCRILAVNRELSGVVLSVGSVHGAFHGLIYYVGKDTARLKVVEVRPFVTAAVLVSGNIEDLSPGMEAVTEATK
ncbi:MAG: hypothetical protein J6M38_02965 [Lentisphaeria bacterium]|nr:hypothetical protein [Lentisphaeria bacterium]